MAPKAVADGSNGVDDALKDLLPEDEDLLYEEELLRNPYSLKMWWRYLDARKEAAAKRRYLLFERALKALPGSYKVPPPFGTTCRQTSWLTLSAPASSCHHCD